jgi:hypothetical protein
VLFRSRFADLVRRQLDLFEEENRGDLEEVRERLELYNAGDRDDAEELYGDYVLVVDAVIDALDHLRDRYAATLDDGAVDEYVRTFDRAAQKRRSIPHRQ